MSPNANPNTNTNTNTTVDRIAVPFRGEGSGEAELTWGQIGIWQAIDESGESRTIGGVTPLPAGYTTVEGVADMLSYMVGRHQALRTRLVFGDGTPRQHCSAEGELPLEVVEVGEADPAEVALHTHERYQAVPFDYEHEWPVRMAAITRGGEVTHIVAVYLHLSVDAGGLDALIADTQARDPRTGQGPPLTGYPPLEQARQQQTPTALRQGASSLRYLEQVLRTASPSRFGPPKPGREQDFAMVRFRSPATRLAVDAVARRAGISTSPVLLACYAVALARFTGNSPVMAMLMVSNRFRPGFADSVSTMVQISPYLIDVADTTLAEAVSRAARSTMNAYKNAYYHPLRQDDVIDAVSADLDEPFDFSCFYNDRRLSDRAAARGEDPTAEQLAAAVARAEAHPEHEAGMPRQKLYVHVDDPADTIEFTVSADTRYFTAADIESLARSMEAVAVQAVLDPAAPTGVHARAGVAR